MLVILSFDEDISTAIKKACDHDSDAMHLARATQVVHKEMFERSSHLMDYSFDNIDYKVLQLLRIHFMALESRHPSHDFVGHHRGVIIINQTTPSTKSVAPLPSKYTNVPPAALKTKQFTVPAVASPKKPINMHIVEQVKEKEFEWLKTVMEALKKHQLEKAD